MLELEPQIAAFSLKAFSSRQGRQTDKAKMERIHFSQYRFTAGYNNNNKDMPRSLSRNSILRQSWIHE